MSLALALVLAQTNGHSEDRISGLPDTPSVQSEAAKQAGGNGYDDYLAAAELARRPVIADLSNWSPILLPSLRDEWKKGVKDSPRQAASLKKRIETLEGLKIRSSDHADRLLEQRLLKVWTLVADGNKKPVFDSRASAAIGRRIPEFASLKMLAKTGPNLAKAKLARGEADQAANLIASEYRFSRRSTSSSVIGYFVGMAMWGITTVGLQEMAPKLPPSGLRAIQVELEADIADLDHLKNSLRGGAREYRELLGKALANPADHAKEAGKGGLESELAKLSPDQLRELEKEVAAWIEDAALSQIRRLDLSESQWSYADPKQSRLSPLAVQLAGMGNPASRELVEALAKHRSRIRAARLMVMGAQYAWIHGQIPARLSDFARELDRVDPLSGKPFEYKVTGAGSFLISIPGTDSRSDVSFGRPGPSGV